MTKAELERRIAEADNSNNHFDQLRLKVEALTQYLLELPNGEAEEPLPEGPAPETEQHPEGAFAEAVATATEEVPPEEPPYEEPPPEEEEEPVVEEQQGFGPPGESDLPPSYGAAQE